MIERSWDGLGTSMVCSAMGWDADGIIHGELARSLTHTHALLACPTSLNHQANATRGARARVRELRAKLPVGGVSYGPCSRGQAMIVSSIARPKISHGCARLHYRTCRFNHVPEGS